MSDTCDRPESAGGGGSPRAWKQHRHALALGLTAVVGLGVGLVLGQSLPALNLWRWGGTSHGEPCALLLLAATPPTVLPRGAREEAIDPYEFSKFQNTQEQLMRSRFVLKAALNSPKVRGVEPLTGLPDPVDWLQKELRCKFVGEILFVSMPSVDPKSAALLVNSIVDAYIKEIVNSERDERLKKLGNLQETYHTYLDWFKKKKEAMRLLSEQTNGVEDQADISKKKHLLEEEISDCRRQALRVRLEKVVLENKLERRKSAKDDSDEARKAIAELESGLTGLTAQEKLLEKEEGRLRDTLRSQSRASLDLNMIQEEIESAASAGRQVGLAIEQMKIEISAPVRVKLIERAEAL